MTTPGSTYWQNIAIPLIAPDLLGEMLADVAVILSPEGKVLSVFVNPAHESLHRLEALEGSDIRASLTPESAEKFDRRFAAFLGGDTERRSVELNHADRVARWEIPVQYSFHNIGRHEAVLMLGRDLRAVAEVQQQLVRAQLAVERDFEIQREFDTRFRVLMESTREPVVFVSAQNGRITDVNSAAAAFFGRTRDDLVEALFVAEFAEPQRDDLIDRLTDLAMSEKGAATTALLARGEAVRITPTLFRASGERLLLCRIEDDQTMTPQADRLSENLRGLYRHGPDAMVFTQPNGIILSANEAFLELINAAHDLELRGRPLSDYLQRGSVDLKVMTENASQGGRMRFYPTRMISEFGSPRPAEIAVTRLDAAGNAVFAFVIRDASRLETARPASAAPAVADDGMRSVMELVGSATLKEIVAETTDVVEKMCIETAVQLTMNNRVAAAEMLGLSRQSLYVKLRKYGLLNRNGE